MNIAIIGLGHVAQYQIEAIQALSGVNLIAAHDINPERAKVLPDERLFEANLDRLLVHPDVDIFLVATPNVTHYTLGKQVLVSGRPLLLEKPCCDSIAEMEELIGLSRDHQALFMVALHAAYARDVLWFEKYVNRRGDDFGPLTSFYSGFFDPYCEDDHLTPGAASLGGSWFDSGINALSVICKFIPPTDMRLIEGRMTAVQAIPCTEIQGIASFGFMSGGHLGTGLIETNWCLGLNRKVTSLSYALSNTRVTLHHTAERVIIERAGKVIHDEVLTTGRARLTNHYVNLFNDVVDRVKAGIGNLHYAVPLHRLLFDARRGVPSVTDG